MMAKDWTKGIPDFLRELAQKFESGKYVPLECEMNADIAEWAPPGKAMMEICYNGQRTLTLKFKDFEKEAEYQKRMDKDFCGDFALLDPRVI